MLLASTITTVTAASEDVVVEETADAANNVEEGDGADGIDYGDVGIYDDEGGV